MPYRVTLIPGDGTGPELATATRRVLEATGVGFDWDIQDAGVDVHKREGTPLPKRVLDSIRKNGVGLKGPITTPVGTGFRSVNVALRKELDLYACERPTKTYPGVRSRYDKVDIVIIRENTEDLYAGIELEKGSSGAAALRAVVMQQTGRDIHEDAGISIKPISASASARIVRHHRRPRGALRADARERAQVRGEGQGQSARDDPERDADAPPPGRGGGGRPAGARGRPRDPGRAARDVRHEGGSARPVGRGNAGGGRRRHPGARRGLTGQAARSHDRGPRQDRGVGRSRRQPLRSVPPREVRAQGRAGRRRRGPRRQRGAPSEPSPPAAARLPVEDPLSGEGRRAWERKPAVRALGRGPDRRGSDG